MVGEKQSWKPNLMENTKSWSPRESEGVQGHLGEIKLLLLEVGKLCPSLPL